MVIYKIDVHPDAGIVNADLSKYSIQKKIGQHCADRVNILRHAGNRSSALEQHNRLGFKASLASAYDVTER